MVDFQQLRNGFQDALPNTSFVIEGDPTYASKIATWNINSHRRPLAVVQPRSTAEVSTAIKTAAGLGIKQICVRGGGHSFEALSLGGRDGALIIDTVNMQDVKADPANKTVTCQGGAMLGQMTVATYEAGKQMVPTGICPAVGVGGQSQCGGYGFSFRTHGTLTDRVLAFEVVTASGEVLQVDDNQNSDLFFALRGSGTGSFGVITSVTFRTNDVPGSMANFSVRWKLDGGHDIPTVLKEAHKATLATPNTFNPMIIGWKGFLEVAGCILADNQEQQKQIFDTFCASLPTKPDTSTINPMDLIDSVIHNEKIQSSAPWYDSIEDVKREGEEYLRFMKIKAGFIPDPLTDSFLERYAEMLLRQPTTGVRSQILLNDPQRVPKPDTTSIKARGWTWLFGGSLFLPAHEYGRENLQAEGDKRLPWLNEAYELFYPLTIGGYLGDDDLDEVKNGRDMFESYFGHHLPRLMEVKQKYDPDNLFNHPLSIPLPKNRSRA